MERKEREHIRQEWVEKQEKIKSKHCYIVTSPTQITSKLYDLLENSDTKIFTFCYAGRSKR